MIMDSGNRQQLGCCMNKDEMPLDVYNKFFEDDTLP